MDEKVKYIHKGFEKRFLSKEDYQKQFFDPVFKEIPYTKVNKETIERAWKNRDFEIEMYWKRATYFWTFIGATFAGYISVLSSDIANKFYQIEFLLTCLGGFLSVVWLLANKGSKFWQENWEYHIDMLEDQFTGPLYKTIKTGSTYSVTGLNSLLNRFMIGIWIILSIKYYTKNKLWEFPNFSIWYNNIDWYSWAIFSMTLILIIFAFKKTSRKSDDQFVGFTYRDRIPV